MLKAFAATLALGVMAACSAAASTSAELPISTAPAAAPAPVVAQAAEVAPATAPVARSVAISSQRAEMMCDVVATPTRHGVLIEAIVRSPYDVAGSYELSILQSGANSSEINQSGDFNADAGSTVTLGQTEMSMDGSHARARLNITDENGASCSRTIRL